MHPEYQVLASRIGSRTTIPNWPSPDLQGLFQALQNWTLDPRIAEVSDDPEHPHAEFDAPCRCLAWGNCVAEPIVEQNMRPRYVGTQPIHEGHPNAVSYCGNFLGYSFGFTVETDDPALIAELDRLIAENMARPEYVSMSKSIAENRRKRGW